jgi:hypothetical protein
MSCPNYLARWDGRSQMHMSIFNKVKWAFQHRFFKFWNTQCSQPTHPSLRYPCLTKKMPVRIKLRRYYSNKLCVIFSVFCTDTANGISSVINSKLTVGILKCKLALVCITRLQEFSMSIRTMYALS